MSKRNDNLSNDQIKFLKDEGYELISVYRKQLGSHLEKRIVIKHLFCGKIYETRFERFFKEGQRCSCLRKRKDALIKNKEDYQEFLNNKYGENVYTIKSEYLGRKKPITIIHNCGYLYSIPRAEFLIDNNSGGKCPICNNGCINTKEILEEKFKKYGQDLTLLESYKKRKLEYLVRNNKCNHEYYIRTYDILKEHGPGCPCCSSKTQSSTGERDLEGYLKSIYPSTQKKKFGKLDFKKIDEDGKRFEIDSYIPELKIGFEYNGLYWHSEKIVGKNGLIKKTNLSKKFGIRLIQVYEDEWQQKNDIIKDKINSILGIQKNKIYARKCSIKKIDPDQKNEFLNKNHIQGADSSYLFYGLFYNNELIAVMTFSKLRLVLGNKKPFDESLSVELSRYAGKIGYTIVGGFSKLLHYAIANNPDIHSIITYADLRWSSELANVYLKNNFKLDHISKPSYYYFKNNKRYNRFNFRKSELKKKFPDIYDDKKSEAEIMSEAGYHRIYDCGNLVYKMIIK